MDQVREKTGAQRSHHTGQMPPQLWLCLQKSLLLASIVTLEDFKGFRGLEKSSPQIPRDIGDVQGALETEEGLS